MQIKKELVLLEKNHFSCNKKISFTCIANTKLISINNIYAYIIYKDFTNNWKWKDFFDNWKLEDFVYKCKWEDFVFYWLQTRRSILIIILNYKLYIFLTKKKTISYKFFHIYITITNDKIFCLHLQSSFFFRDIFDVYKKEKKN